MGVLNCTPDSFSDGGQFLGERAALERALCMLDEGADLIDVGAESTRPTAATVAPAEQSARIGGLIRDLARRGAQVSIDTTSAEVARRALDDGAVCINSVDLAAAASLAAIARSYDASLVLMHSRGPMTRMPGFSATEEKAYGDVVSDVAREWSVARDEAVDAGLARDRILLDPGLGFHKSARHSLELCARLGELALLGHPVLVGPSRKSFVAVVSAPVGAPIAPPGERLGATLAACLLCARQGAAVLRIHDVAEVRQALRFERATALVQREAPRV